MIQGLRTVIYPVADLTEGKAWYGRSPGTRAVLRRALLRGILGRRVRARADPRRRPEPVGAQAYWGVADAAAELARLTTLGAEVHEPVKDVGGGIKVASVKDPFGNVFGLIENPHFDPKGVE